MCKLDQFQVRAARLPAGLRPLSARFRVSKGEDATMKSARDGNDASAATRPTTRATHSSVSKNWNVAARRVSLTLSFP
jgi:hypothetical protein